MYLRDFSVPRSCARRSWVTSIDLIPCRPCRGCPLTADLGTSVRNGRERPKAAVWASAVPIGSGSHPLDKLIYIAQEEIDQLYEVVREAGYTVLFCDSSGVAVAHRGEQTRAREFQHWGTWLGGVWSEEVEGTNGIGTCIVDERPVTVHRSQHFRSRHINLSCSGAPVFGVDGRLIAVLDVSAIDPELSERGHALTGALTVRSARDRRAIFS
jgi:transcriptional regulator of acetoin/glycerol metabolism